MITLHLPRQANRKIHYRSVTELRKNLREMWGVARLYSYSHINEDGATVTLVYPSLGEMRQDQDGSYAASYLPGGSRN